MSRRIQRNEGAAVSKCFDTIAKLFFAIAKSLSSFVKMTFCFLKNVLIDDMI